MRIYNLLLELSKLVNFFFFFLQKDKKRRLTVTIISGHEYDYKNLMIFFLIWKLVMCMFGNFCQKKDSLPPVSNTSSRCQLECKLKPHLYLFFGTSKSEGRHHFLQEKWYPKRTGWTQNGDKSCWIFNFFWKSIGANSKY